MNLKKITLLAGLLACLTVPAFAQGGRGYDEFGVPRTLVLFAPTNTGAAGGGTGTTNTGSPLDLRRFVGVVKIDFPACQTNAAFAANGTVIVTPQTSQDTTNWASLGNYALISNSTTLLNTNLQYTNAIGTNVYMLPGTQVTNVAATAGVAGYSLASLPYTNSGAFTMTNVPWEIGFDIGTLPSNTNRYLRLQVAISGTNWFFSGATLTAPTTTYIQPYFP